MTNTKTTTAPRDIDAELITLHGSTIERGPWWRTASMPDQTMRIEVEVYPLEHHMTAKSRAGMIAKYLGCTVGKFLGLTYVQVDGIQQIRRVYELSFAE